jgi:hypothetical protein
MTDPQIFAWILISVSDRGSTLQDLIARADAIMHCLPTHQELQKSLGWLIHRDLVETQDRRYFLTPAGRDLLARLRKPAQGAMELWNATTSEFTRWEVVSAPLHNLAPRDVLQAYSAYQKEFWAHYRKLLEKDSVSAAARRSTASLGGSDPPNRSSRERMPFHDWAYKNPRMAGAFVALSGVIVVLDLRLMAIHSSKFRFFGLLLSFGGVWVIVTNRIYHPEDKPPVWWSIGCLMLIALAFVIS